MADDILEELDDWAHIVDESRGAAAVVMLSGDVFRRAADEIERLRAAGDALAATWPEEERCGCNNSDCRAVVEAFDAWQEARRG